MYQLTSLKEPCHILILRRLKWVIKVSLTINFLLVVVIVTSIGTEMLVVVNMVVGTLCNVKFATSLCMMPTTTTTTSDTHKIRMVYLQPLVNMVNLILISGLNLATNPHLSCLPLFQTCESLHAVKIHTSKARSSCHKH